jgi:uncharacterized phage protein (TIGR02218 family)
MPTFPLKIQSGASGGPVFRTSIVRTDAEKEFRNADWWDPRWMWNFELLVGSADLATLESFFAARRGRHEEFFFRRPYELLQSGTLPPLWRARFDQDDLAYDFDVSQKVRVQVREFVEGGLPDFPTDDDFPANSDERLILADTAGRQERVTGYETVILGADSVAEVRAATHAGRRRWVVRYEALSLAKILELQDFFIARRGRAQAFLLELYDGSTVRVRFDRDSFDAAYRPLRVGAVGDLPLIEVLDFSPPAETGVEVRDYLSRQATTLATLYTLTARNGTVARLCNATRAFERGSGGSSGESLTWTPAPIEKSEIERVIGLQPDNTEIVVPYMGESLSLTRELFLRGLWDDAQAEIETVDYLSGLTIERRVFRVGDVRALRLSAALDLRSLSALLNQDRGETYSPTCRVRRFGDAECGFDVESVSFETEIAEVIDAYRLRIILAGVPFSIAENDYASGEIVFLEGPMAGRIFKIKSSTAPPLVITLQLPLPFSTMGAIDVRIVKGCDRSPARCKFFNNFTRFRGEPHVQSVAEMLQIQRAR